MKKQIPLTLAIFLSLCYLSVLNSQTISTFPHTESFESSTSPWSTITTNLGCNSNGQWSRTNSRTSSSNTGPSSAQSGSYYVYTEASSGCHNRTFYLKSTVDLRNQTNGNISFYYHMYGTSMGTLFLEISDNNSSWQTLTSISGNQANAWLNRSVSIPSSYNNKIVYIRFRGVTGSSFSSDMAVDNIKIEVSGSSTGGSGGSTCNQWSGTCNLTSNIYRTGNVGIGISPAEKLHVNGSVRGNIGGGALRIKSQYGYLDVGPQNSSWAHIYTDRPKIIFNRDIYTTSNAFSSYSNDLILKTRGTERVRIKDEDGSIQTSVSSPNTPTLAVNLNGTRNFTVMGSGKVYAREVEVHLNNFPDYVFEENYDLMPLNELQNYIEEHGHLPNVPSAEQVEKEGLGLGDFSKIQLEKIEELTLHIIELNNKIQALEEQLASDK